jgi:hypothetical protein
MRAITVKFLMGLTELQANIAMAALVWPWDAEDIAVNQMLRIMVATAERAERCKP